MGLNNEGDCATTDCCSAGEQPSPRPLQLPNQYPVSSEVIAKVAASSVGAVSRPRLPLIRRDSDMFSSL
jgi:hypothetical protein